MPPNRGESPFRRKAWAAIQQRLIRDQRQRDFNELWTEAPRQRPAADGDARTAAAPCRIGGPSPRVGRRKTMSNRRFIDNG